MLLLAVTAGLLGVWVVGQVTEVPGPETVDLAPPPTEGASSDDEVAAPRPAGIPEDAEPAILERVVDGDTVRVVTEPDGAIAIDSDVEAGGSVRVRLLNIDAPELARDGRPAECGAEEATARVQKLLAPGELIWLAGDAEDRDRYDRPLRAVWTADGRFVNVVLAEEGLAEPLLIPPNDRFHDEVESAATNAQDAGRGIWGEPCRR